MTFFSASCLDWVLITHERPKQRHFKQRHKTRIISHGNFGFPAELLFSCCKTLYTISVPLPLSLSCGEVSAPCLPQHPDCHSLMGWGCWGGQGAKPSWAWELCCALAGRQSLPTAPLCSLLDPEQRGSHCSWVLQGTRPCSAVSICENVQIPKLNPGLATLFFT